MSSVTGLICRIKPFPSCAEFLGPIDLVMGIDCRCHLHDQDSIAGGVVPLSSYLVIETVDSLSYRRWEEFLFKRCIFIHLECLLTLICHYAMRRGGRAPHILNLGTRWRVFIAEEVERGEDKESGDTTTVDVDIIGGLFEHVTDICLLP